MLLPLLLVITLVSSASGQESFTRIYGPQDQEIAVPKFVPVTGNKDTTALQTIQAFLTAVSAASWPGIQATGTFTNAGSSQAAPQPATLTIAGGDNFRLDVNTPAGTLSVRIYGKFEEVQEPDGTKRSIPFLASVAGLLAFPKLLQASGLAPDSVTILDDGMITVSGENLHRITVETPVNPSGPKPSSANTSVMDLYFDPASHLLIKSAVAVPISWSDPERYLEVTTYGDYQTANGILLPHTCSLTMNGQPEWVLQLESIQPLPSLTSTYFHF